MAAGSSTLSKGSIVNRALITRETTEIIEFCIRPSSITQNSGRPNPPETQLTLTEFSPAKGRTGGTS
jgi:hypothetical protein